MKSKHRRSRFLEKAVALQSSAKGFARLPDDIVADLREIAGMIEAGTYKASLRSLHSALLDELKSRGLPPVGRWSFTEGMNRLRNANK